MTNRKRTTKSICGSFAAYCLFVFCVACGKQNTPQTAESEPSMGAMGALTEDAAAEAVRTEEVAADGVSVDSTADEVDERDLTEADPAQLFEDASDAFSEGDSDRAFRLIRQANKLDSASPDITFLMAQVLAERNRFAEAVKLLDEFAARQPDARFPVLGQTADWLVIAGRWEEAESRFREILKEIPDASLAQRALARLLMRQGRQWEAADLLRDLCRAGVVEPGNLRSLLRVAYPLDATERPEDLEPIGAIGQARLEMTRDQWDAALVALEQPSTETDARALVGRIHALRDEKTDLQDWASEFTGPLRDSPDYWFADGSNSQNNGDHQAAIEAFCNVVRTDPTDAEAYARLSESLREIGLDSQANEAKKRSELILRTQDLGDRIIASSGESVQEIANLAELLMQLRRPFEAYAWRTLGLSIRKASSLLSEEAARKEMTELNADRMRELESQTQTDSEEFILCGIDLQSLPD